MQLCVFEDAQVENLLPLVYLRPAFDLRCGITCLLDKITAQYPGAKLCLMCRDILKEVVAEKYPGIAINKITEADAYLFINGRILADNNLAGKIPLEGKDEVFYSGENLVAIRLSGEKIKLIKGNLANLGSKQITKDIPKTPVDVKMINFPWDLVKENPGQIREDFKTLAKASIRGQVFKEAVIYETAKDIFIDDGAQIESQVVIDNRNGPVYIDKGARVQPFCRIEGPVYIGENAVINSGANIRSGASIGPLCKISGEIENSIFHGYSNKQHYGFIGHSYICEWVNLGAGTTNSDLKNNYSTIKVTINNKEINTKEQFVGCFIADHSKTGIGTYITTGAVIGIFANIFGGGITPKVIPSFSWGTAQKLDKYDLEKALETAGAVMERRGKKLSPASKALVEQIKKQTA